MKLNALAGESISEASIVCMVLSPPLFSATLSVLSFYGADVVEDFSLHYTFGIHFLEHS